MKPDLSEFSYGFALTSEIVRMCGTSLVGAPVFPSLIEEGGLGYDLKLPLLGRPVFIQFKLSDHMIRSSAGCSDKVPTPHYRMHLRPLKHSQQHNLLLALEAQGYRVLYAAPEFHASSDLNDAYLNGRMIEKTAFFRPAAIGRLDDGPHFVCFKPNTDHGFVCSDPSRVEREPPEAVREVLEGMAPAADRVRPADERLREMADELVSCWIKLSEPPGKFQDTVTRIRQARVPSEYFGWVAQALFNCAAFVRLDRKK